ncbi:MAG: metal ABC transporter permease [Actinomycetota bacterium]|jgi:ABC-type Mn2+/Zn2+ transport system permease subunit|nr:metal ABC transporter permease [Actinomycetota bacterium]
MVAAEAHVVLAIAVLDWIAEPWGAGFMRRAFVEAVLCGATLGALGCFVLVRRLSFLGESISHTIVLGAALALVLGLPLGLGGVLVAVATAGLTGVLASDRRLSADTATGILLPTLFAAGVAVLALTDGSRRLDDLLFGSILGVGTGDLVLAGIVALAVLIVLWGAGKELAFVAFDRASARALGYRVALLDAVLLTLVAVAVTAGLRAVGSILLAGLLLGPPLAARLVCRTFWPMVAVAAGLGAACGLGGLYLTWHLAIGAGPAIVLVVALVVGLAALAGAGGPKREARGRAVRGALVR